MDNSKIIFQVDQSLIDDLTTHVNFLYCYIDRRLPDCLAKKFALDDLADVESYFLDYLKPLN